MTLKVKVRQGGLAGAATKDFTDQVPIFDDSGNPQLSAGMMYGEGHGCQSAFPIDDPIGQIPEFGVAQVEPHNVVWITEDAPGHEAWLCRARVARGEGDRGVFTIGAARQLQVVVEDANVDLRGLALTAPWVRPAETATERVMAAIAAFCQGDPRVTTQITAERWNAMGTGHLVKPHPTDGEVTMTAETYPATTDLLDIIRACAETEGQNWGVVIHHAGGSHLCFLWTEEDDWDTYPCPLTITDDTPDLVTEFPPIWDQGAAVVEEGQDVLHAALTKWGTGEESFAFAERPANIERYDYWVESLNDATSQSQSQADQRAGHLLAGRAHKHVTHQVSLLLPASMVDQVCAGMSIPIRAAASRSSEAAGATVIRRVAQVKWEPVSPKVGGSERLYMAHMQLARPLKIARERRPEAKPKPPKSGTPGTEPTTDYHWGFEGTNLEDGGSFPFGGYGNLDSGGAYNNSGTNTAIALETPFPPIIAGEDYTLTAIIENRDGDTPSDLVRLFWSVSAGSNGTSLLGSGQTAAGVTGGVAPSEVSTTFTAPGTPGDTVYLSVFIRHDSGSGWRQGIYDLLVQHGGSTGSTGDTTTPIGTDDPDASSGQYAGLYHSHKHDDQSGDPGAEHAAAQVGIADAGGHFTGTDVEAALQELGASGGGSHPDLSTHDALGLATDAELAAHAADTGLHGGGGGGGGGGASYTDMDDPPASPHASDMEGASLTGWAWLTSSGTVTQQSGILEAMFDSDAGPGANPLYNVDADVAGQVVFQPVNAGKLAMYHAWAPAAGTEWVAVVKARMIPGNNEGNSDDRLMIGVTSDATPSIAANEIANSIAAELRTSGTAYGHGLIRPGARSNEHGDGSGLVYAAVVGRADNSIQVYSSTDGMWWRRKGHITSGTAPAGAGTVKNVFVYCQDLTNNGMAPVIIVDWVRFATGTTNPLRVGGGR